MMELRYLGLVGKYVDARRPAEAAEVESMGLTEIGGAGIVARLEPVRVPYASGPSGTELEAVDLTFDYGYGFRITEVDEKRWALTVYPDEQAAELFNPRPGGLSRRLVADQVIAELNQVERLGVKFFAVDGNVAMSPSSARALMQWIRQAR